MGLATFPHDAQTPHDIIRQADEMMYMVKNTTRDNIGVASQGLMENVDEQVSGLRCQVSENSYRFESLLIAFLAAAGRRAYLLLAGGLPAPASMCAAFAGADGFTPKSQT